MTQGWNLKNKKILKMEVVFDKDAFWNHIKTISAAMKVFMFLLFIFIFIKIFLMKNCNVYFVEGWYWFSM